jgi:hypothetical protein
MPLTQASFGENVGNAVQAVADDVQSVVISATGHFLAEESPDELLAVLTAFLAPYRDGSASAREPSRVVPGRAVLEWLRALAHWGPRG